MNPLHTFNENFSLMRKYGTEKAKKKTKTKQKMAKNRSFWLANVYA